MYKNKTSLKIRIVPPHKKSSVRRIADMDDVVHEKVAGLDIHEKTIVVCVLYTPNGKIKPKKEFSTFSTTTKGLLKSSDWLDTFDIELLFFD